MKYLLSIFSIFIFIDQSQAIIIRADSDFDLQKSQQWAAENFPSVCDVIVADQDNVGHGTGVLVSPTSILTAAHVVREKGEVAKNVIVNFSPTVDFMSLERLFYNPFRCIEEIIVHPEVDKDERNLCNGVDLAILKFKNPIESIVPVKLYEDDVKENAKAYIVGYGEFGTNDIGAIQNEKKHIRHMGTTRITGQNESYLTYGYEPIKLESPLDTFVVNKKMDKLQSIATKGDSGSPLLFGEAPNNLSIAGIYESVRIPLFGGVVHSQWISLQPHLHWIKKNIK